MATELVLDDFRRMAARAGLSLSDEELQKLLPGVKRSQQQLIELRALLSDEIEPAAYFPVTTGDR